MLVKKIKNVISGITVAALICVLSACANNNSADQNIQATGTAASDEQSVESDEQSADSEAESDTDTKTENDNRSQNDLKISDSQDTPTSINIDTEAATRAFIAGEWKLLNRDTNEDYASMVFTGDGSCTFTRLEDNVSCKGRIYFEKDTREGGNPDGFRLELNGIEGFTDGEPSTVQEGSDRVTVLASDRTKSDNKLSSLEETQGSAEQDSSTSGIYHIGIGEGRDYLYLAEIGNGDSEISLSVFNVNGTDDFEHLSNEWLFYRDNDVKSSQNPIRDEEFYAFAWGRGKDGSVLLQKMNSFEFETYEDYTDRAFLAAYFGETEDPQVIEYKLGEGTDTGSFLHEDRFAGWPLYVYSVTTDSEGTITDISEVNQSMYGVYDLGNLEPVFRYEDQTFYYNNSTFELKDFAPGTNAITGCEKVGDFIILQCHANPHYSDNIFFNIYSGDFAFDCLGANLTYENKDLSTAVYSVYNDIYDIWGNHIGSVQEGEVFGLTFTGKNTIGAECWAIVDGEEKTFTEEFEFEPVDHSMFTYYRYLLSINRCSLWKEFVNEAPDNAAALLIVNAPNMIYDRIMRPNIYEEGGLDTVALVSLHDNQKAFFEGTEPDASGNVTDRSDDYELQKANGIQFTVTVPEGMPIKNLVIRNLGGKELIWPVATLSGRVPQRSIFLSY